MICRMRNPATAIYHLFQYDLSFCIIVSRKAAKTRKAAKWKYLFTLRFLRAFA